MTNPAWRVVPRVFSEPPYSAFDGEGAKRSGGRWNSPGVPVVYCSWSVSLAVLEQLVHARGEVASLRDMVMFPVRIPDGAVAEIDPSTLPSEWDDPDSRVKTTQLGDDWVAAARTPVLRILSAVVSVEFNYVLNPLHPDFSRIVIGGRQPLPIDPRLLGK